MSCNGISWAVCKFASHSRHITTPAPHHQMPFLPPSQQHRSTEVHSAINRASPYTLLFIRKTLHTFASWDFNNFNNLIIFTGVFSRKPATERWHDFPLHLNSVSALPCKTGWRRGVVVSGVRCMNEVNLRRARLLPGWVTFSRRPSRYVTSQLG